MSQPHVAELGTVNLAGCVAARLDGYSMEPIGYEGDFVIVDPSATVGDGDLAIVKTPGKWIFKRVWLFDEDLRPVATWSEEVAHVICSSANPKCGFRRFARAELQEVHRVVGMVYAKERWSRRRDPRLEFTNAEVEAAIAAGVPGPLRKRGSIPAALEGPKPGRAFVNA